MTADAKITSVTLEQSFRTYGLFVDYGTGRNTPCGNSGDLGEGFTNRRLSPLGASLAKNRRRWFSRNYFASVMNICEFLADNLCKDMADTISKPLTRDISRRYVQ